MKKPKLIIVRGLPGAGKSTLAAKLSLLSNYSHVETDQFFSTEDGYVFKRELLPEAHTWCRITAQKAINKGVGAIVANTFTTYEEVKAYLQMVDSYDDLLVITLSSSFGSIHDVPEEAMQRMANRFLSHEALAFQIQQYFISKES